MNPEDELKSRIMELQQLLSEENDLRNGRNPWICNEEDCPYYNRPSARACECALEETQAHNSRVKVALAKGVQ